VDARAPEAAAAAVAAAVAAAAAVLKGPAEIDGEGAGVGSCERALEGDASMG
jgi:hypothetical protein